MKLPALICSDLHLTANPRDAYRWGLFPWLCEQIDKHKVQTVLILGDLTDAKDYHVSTLVNQVVESILLLRDRHSVKDVVILKGNHDYLKDGHAFFDFLSSFDGVSFISEPTGEIGPEMSVLYLPHTKTPDKDWQKCNFSHYDYVFMHQTVKGAIASNGQKMDGEFEGSRSGLPVIQIYSGDIHVPQDVGNVRYVGSPYPVHFGDHFDARCLLVDEDCSEVSLHFPTIQKMSVTLTMDDLADFGRSAASWDPGDQLKVKVELDAASKHQWDRIRKDIISTCKKAKVSLHGLSMVVKKGRRLVVQPGKTLEKTPQDIVTRFVKDEDLGGDILDTGLEILS